MRTANKNRQTNYSKYSSAAVKTTQAEATVAVLTNKQV